MKTIRWGMIGCGDVAEMKSGPGFYKAAHSQLVAVMRRNGALAADYARRHGVPRWHDDADAIIRADDIDAVYIATLTDSHREYTLRCAAAGKPVYVEKPMAMSHGECTEMIAACRAAGVPLWVGYYRRALPRFLAVRDLVRDGAIGAVRMVRLAAVPAAADAGAAARRRPAWRVDPARSGRRLLLRGRLPHARLLRFPPRPDRRCARSPATRRASDAGRRGQRDVALRVGRVRQRRVVLRRRLSTRNGTRSSAPRGASGSRRRARSRSGSMRDDRVEEFPVGDPPHVHQPLIQTIVDELNGGDAAPSTGESAARTAWVMDEILAGFRARL